MRRRGKSEREGIEGMMSAIAVSLAARHGVRRMKGGPGGLSAARRLVNVGGMRA